MLSINYKDPRPIYEQVRDALRQLILSGAIGPGEKLPSVRELEHLGLIYTQPGKGAFAARDNTAAQRRKEELLEQLEGVVRELKTLSVEEGKIEERIKRVYGEEESK